MRKLVAFVITVIIYALLILLYLMQFRDMKVTPVSQSETIIKMDIKEMPSPAPPKVSKTIMQNKPNLSKEKPLQPKKEPKKIVKKQTTPPKPKQTKQVVIKEAKKKVPKETKKVVQPSEMLYIPNPIIQNNAAQENSSLASVLGKEETSLPKQSSVPKSPKIAQLYGKKFDTFTPNQQKFIAQNLDEIQHITQNTLTRRGYPEGALAARTGQEGVNIASFDLHPNGNISNLQLVRPIGYRALDENTLETIKSAYKDYPYPTETTKIIFYVEYTIFGY